MRDLSPRISLNTGTVIDPAHGAILGDDSIFLLELVHAPLGIPPQLMADALKILWIYQRSKAKRPIEEFFGGIAELFDVVRDERHRPTVLGSPAEQHHRTVFHDQVRLP